MCKKEKTEAETEPGVVEKASRMDDDVGPTKVSTPSGMHSQWRKEQISDIT